MTPFQRFLLLVVALLALGFAIWMLFNLRRHHTNVGNIMGHNVRQLENLERMTRHLEESNADIYNAASDAVSRIPVEDDELLTMLPQVPYVPSKSDMVHPTVIHVATTPTIRLVPHDRVYELHGMQETNTPCRVILPRASTIELGHCFTVSLPICKQSEPVRTVIFSLSDTNNDTLTYINPQNYRETECGTEYTLEHRSKSIVRVLLYTDNRTEWFMQIAKE